MVAMVEVCAIFFPHPCSRHKLMDGRYNTFYVLYPVGISSECALAFKALSPAEEFHPLYWWFIVAVLAIYVPGMSTQIPGVFPMIS